MTNNLIPIKAINEYRRNDIVSYLGLRYYLDNTCTERDTWHTDIAMSQVMSNSASSYLHLKYFKKISEQIAQHRSIYAPPPSEMLAETVLISECSKHAAFLPHHCVYSYHLREHKDTSGLFKYYFEGYTEKNNTIRNRCSQDTSLAVHITDIVNFYPSITQELALNAWQHACSQSKIPKKYISLGEKLISNHTSKSKADNTGLCLLTGPMISHLVANLVLSKIDRRMNRLTRGNYWRYVDDITLVGSNAEIESWSKTLHDLLEEISLKLHPHDSDKCHTESARNWADNLPSKDDLSKPWIQLIFSIKSFLLFNPAKTNELASIIEEMDARIPILNYSKAVSDASYLKNIKQKIKIHGFWFAKYLRKNKAEDISHLITNCRDFYSNKLFEFIGELDKEKSKSKYKHLISQIKFCTGRLLTISPKDALKQIESGVANIKEMALLKEIINAVSSHDFSTLSTMGCNATQSAAQLLRKSKIPVICQQIEDPVVNQSISVILLNGIGLKNEIHAHDDLIRFSMSRDMSSLMNSADAFIREIACLHGNLPSRHNKTLDTAFNIDEKLRIDIINRISTFNYY